MFGCNKQQQRKSTGANKHTKHFSFQKFIFSFNNDEYLLLLVFCVFVTTNCFRNSNAKCKKWINIQYISIAKFVSSKIRYDSIDDDDVGFSFFFSIFNPGLLLLFFRILLHNICFCFVLLECLCLCVAGCQCMVTSHHIKSSSNHNCDGQAINLNIFIIGFFYWLFLFGCCFFCAIINDYFDTLWM